MSKLPMETRPIRVAPDVARYLEGLLRPLTGKKLDAAQQAIIRVYQSGKQGSHSEWVEWYTDAIAAATRDKVAA